MSTFKTVREKWKQRAVVRNVWVDRVAVLAAVVALLRMSLMIVPAPTPAFALFGELVYDLCLALVGAWVFNLFLIDIPAIRKRETLLEASASDLTKIANKADLFYKALCVKKGRKPLPDPSVEEIESVCASIKRDSRAPFYLFRGDITSESLDWVEYFENHLDDARDARSRLTPALVYLDWQIVAALAPLSDTRFERFIRSSSRHGFAAPNLKELAQPLHDYLQLSKPLQTYLQNSKVRGLAAQAPAEPASGC
jgi:hypothetical protein